MRWLALVAALMAPAGALAAACPPAGADFPPFYTDAGLFDRALDRAASIAPLKEPPTGLIVPHHLLADRLVAGGFRLAAGGRYRRIVILFPDHFRQAGKAFAVPATGFETLFGRVATDGDGAAALLADDARVERSCLFGRDHGLQAMLPFVARQFPGTPVLPVAVSIRSTRADWEAMADRLAGLVDAETLVVESTDFSHYLPQAEARRRDQQTLNLMAAGDEDGLARLVQPDHVDSLGALFIQLRLQEARHGARPIVVANENSQIYSPRPAAETTSYVVAVFSPALAASPAPAFAGATVSYFAGDTFFGRAMMTALADPDAAALVRAAVLASTAGRPLIVNLEGIVLPNVPAGLGPLTLAMPARLALPFLAGLNVAGVGLANNHVHDLGPDGLAETRAALAGAGLPAFGQGERLDRPDLTVFGFTDLDSTAAVPTGLLTGGLLDRLAAAPPDRPAVAFVHWGREWIDHPSPREADLADQMRRRGATLVIGAHPHVATSTMTALAGGDTLVIHSIGNFLFDQTGDKASGALVEVTTFAQGTAFARLVPIPDLFDLAVAAGRR